MNPLARSAHVSLKDRAVLALRDMGQGSSRDVAQATGLRTEQVQDALRRAESRGQAHRCGGHIVADGVWSTCWHASRVLPREDR